MQHNKKYFCFPVAFFPAPRLIKREVDTEIQAYAKDPAHLGGTEGLIRQEITLAQVIDGVVYLPVRDVFRSNAVLYGAPCSSASNSLNC